MIDRESLLISCDGDARIREVQRVLERENLTLALAGELPDMSVAEWIAKGAPGARARFVDPVDQLVAGFVARFHDGHVVVVEPAPRRSVGPDLLALLFGQEERFAKITRAHLRAVLQDGTYSSPPFRYADPPVNEGERALAEEIARVLALR